MTKQCVTDLFEYNYWATKQLLRLVESLSVSEFVAPSAFTYRNLRATLVHTLDVERSWRRRLQGQPSEAWDVELLPESFPTAQSLRDAWWQDEQEMRTWLEGLDDEAVERVVDLGPRDQFPLAFFLLHIVTHSTHQRRDAALLLDHGGHPPPEIDFLNYADSLKDAAQA